MSTKSSTHTDVCLSIVNAEIIDELEPETLYAIKVRGGYTTEEQADIAATKLRETDLDNDVMVGPMGVWLAMDHRKHYTTNKYEQSELDEIMNPKKLSKTGKEGEIEFTSDTKPYERRSLKSLPDANEDYLVVDKAIRGQTYYCFSYVTEKEFDRTVTTVAAESVGTESTDSAATDPAATDPAATDPAATDPVPTRPPSSIVCFKILGIFSSMLEAQTFATSKVSANNIYVSEVGKWTLLDTRLGASERTDVSETQMNKLMKFIRDERLNQAKEFKERLSKARTSAADKK
jgi:hypothetical protein